MIVYSVTETVDILSRL